jgi:hypothetical protein
MRSSGAHRERDRLVALLARVCSARQNSSVWQRYPHLEPCRNRLVVGDNSAQEHMTPVLRPGPSGSDAERHQIKDRRGISMINVA